MLGIIINYYEEGANQFLENLFSLLPSNIEPE